MHTNTLTHASAKLYYIMSPRALHRQRRGFSVFFASRCEKTARSSGAAITIVRNDMCMNEYHTMCRRIFLSCFHRTKPNTFMNGRTLYSDSEQNQIQSNRADTCTARSELFKRYVHDIKYTSKAASNNTFKSKRSAAPYSPI